MVAATVTIAVVMEWLLKNDRVAMGMEVRLGPGKRRLTAGGLIRTDSVSSFPWCAERVRRRVTVVQIS